MTQGYFNLTSDPTHPEYPKQEADGKCYVTLQYCAQTSQLTGTN